MAAQMLQGGMRWCRRAQVGQDRPVERTGGERGTHTGIDPGCPSCLSPNILFNQTRWSSCSKVIVIVISKFLKRHSKAKRRAPAYSRAMRLVRRVVQESSPWEVRVRFPVDQRGQSSC